MTHDTDFLVLSLVHRDFSQCSYDIMCCRWFSQCNFMLSTLLWNLCPALRLKLCLYKVVFLYPVMLLMFKMSYIFLNVHFLLFKSFTMNKMWVCEICKSLPSVFLLEIIPSFSELSFFCLPIQLEIPNLEKKIRRTHTKQQLFFILPVSC